jgi:hypothetical protein
MSVTCTFAWPAHVVAASWTAPAGTEPPVRFWMAPARVWKDDDEGSEAARVVDTRVPTAAPTEEIVPFRAVVRAGEEGTRTSNVMTVTGRRPDVAMRAAVRLKVGKADKDAGSVATSEPGPLRRVLRGDVEETDHVPVE